MAAKPIKQKVTNITTFLLLRLCTRVRDTFWMDLGRYVAVIPANVMESNRKTTVVDTKVK